MSEEFTQLQILGYSQTKEIGKPQLPKINLLYAVANPEVSIEIIDTKISEKRWVGKVYPAQPPQIDREKPKQVDFQIDDTFYTTDTYYPNSVARLYEKGYIRDIAFVNSLYFLFNIILTQKLQRYMRK